MLMARAEADKDWWKFWVYFKFVIKRLLPYMDIDARVALEADWQELTRLEREIETGKDPEPTQARNIEKLRLSFIKNHESYISLSLPRTGLITVTEDSLVDFNKHDFDIFKRAIRSGSEISKSIEEAQKKEEVKKDGPPS